MSRLTLRWFNLSQKEGQDLLLKVPIGNIYAPIIDRAFPDIERIDWRESTQGTCFTYIKNITLRDFHLLEDFLKLLEKIQCLTLTTHLETHFQRDLDEAYALDFNFQPEIFPLAYTETGTLEHLAKDRQDSAALAKLIARLVEVVRLHPTFARAEMIAPMPPRPSKDFHLPVELAKGIRAELGLPICQLTKTEHQKLRSLPLKQKLDALTGAFSLDGSVEGRSVLIVDDLYQSGASAWSLAKFLKSRGAKQVYAITCVKSWRDTDNQ